MASVKHLGLFPWCTFKDYDSLRSFYSFITDEQWDPRLLYYDNFTTSLINGMALYWRVKSWKIFGTQTLFLPDNEPDYIDFEFIFNRDAGSELNLICKTFSDESGFGILPLVEDGENVRYYTPSRIFTTPYPMLCFFQIPSTGVNLALPANAPMGGHFEGESFSPHLDFSFTGNDAGGDFNATNAGLINQTSFGFSSSLESLPISFLGETYNLQYYIQGPESGCFFENITIEAIEYWEYDPEDGGGPIYDKFTGAVLRPEYFDI
jgi:hypothetical protein